MTSEDKLRIYDKVSEILLDLEYEKKRMVSRSQFVALSTVDEARLNFLDKMVRKVKRVVKELER